MNGWKYLKTVLIVSLLLLAMLHNVPYVHSQDSQSDESKDMNSSIQQLIKQLKDKERSVRQEASSELIKIKDPAAVEPLIDALKDKEPSVRCEVVRALRNIRDLRAVKALINSLRDEEMVVRGDAAFSLASMVSEPSGKNAYPEAIEALISALKDENHYTREGAATALLYVKDINAIKALINVLKDDQDHEVREAAARTLGYKDNTIVIEPLINAFKDTNPHVRREAAEGLAEHLMPSPGPLGKEVKGLGEAEASRVAEALVNASKTNNLAVVAGAYFFFIDRGEEGTETCLAKALKEYGDSGRARRYITCGNPVLEKAGQEWFEKHPHVKKGILRHDLKWGANLQHKTKK